MFTFGDPNNPFVAYFVNNIEWEQEGITATNFYFQVKVSMF